MAEEAPQLQVQEQQMCGGAAPPREIGGDDLEVLNSVRADVMVGAKGAIPGLDDAAEYQVLEVSTQVVAGTNFFFKLQFGDKMVIAKVFRPLPHTGAPPQVTEVTAA
eukprot:g4575.t1